MSWFSSPRFLPEPPLNTSAPERCAVLYCNLGTPDAPTPAAVRRFLAEFLSDRRVVELPRWLWLLILHGVILRVRPAKSAAKYASIWGPEGSPLLRWTAYQAQRLQTELVQRGVARPKDLQVDYAMRYGSRSIAEQLDALKAQGVTRVLILPAYPQYSATTTASVFDAVYAWAARVRRLPELRFVNGYHRHPAYIGALAASIQRYWQAHGQGQHLVLSFHGLPQRNSALGDPYEGECRQTAALLIAQLGLRTDQFSVTFQSRLGRAAWLQPYTEPSLVALASKGVARVDVVCPGFTGDCLETLEEINMEARAAFISAGGQAFHYIPCLNDDPAWIRALGDIAQHHLGGWCDPV